jgi:hypothetical protein
VTTYEVEVTAFGEGGRNSKFTTQLISEVEAIVDSVPLAAGVVFVAALAHGVDHGNFYLYRNESGVTHIMLHEHRGHFARDPLVQAPHQMVAFRGKDGSVFSVPVDATTSWERGKRALLHWLPAQAHWPDLIWESGDAT